MFGSSLLGFRKKVTGNQKNLADKHTKVLISMMETINNNNDETKENLKEKQLKLHEMLANVVEELDNDQMTTEGFQFFSFTWDKTNDLISKKMNDLK